MNDKCPNCGSENIDHYIEGGFGISEQGVMKLNCFDCEHEWEKKL